MLIQAAVVGSILVGRALANICTTSGSSCSASTQQFNSIASFASPKHCVPLGYFQATDYGTVTPQSLACKCEAQCKSYGSKCTAYVGELWKAADSNLYTGQCFYFSTAPTAPRACADAPTTIFAEKKDNSLSCLISNKSAATAYCSSYLSIGTATKYTSTKTPTKYVSFL
jgi:hypothetical protein